MNFKTANDKFMIGDHISDKELADLNEHYRDLINLSEPLGREFDLYNNELRRRFRLLEDFKMARNRG